MNILIACEHSGRIRDAMIKKGHNVWSVDLLAGSGVYTDRHIAGDVCKLFSNTVITLPDGTLAVHSYWDLVIAHPPCTYLTIAAEWAYNEHQTKNIKPGTLIGKERITAREQAVKFFMMFVDNTTCKLAIENPIGIMSSCYRKPDQYIQPYDFGHDASKRTCLWLRGLPDLVPTAYINPRIVNGKPRWSNQTDSGQNRLPPSVDRAHIRSLTYQGWADAIAEQWG